MNIMVCSKEQFGAQRVDSGPACGTKPPILTANGHSLSCWRLARDDGRTS